MGDKTQIQWTDATWNIARGCTKVDEECAKNARVKFEHIDSFLVSPKEFVVG